MTWLFSMVEARPEGAAPLRRGLVRSNAAPEEMIALPPMREAGRVAAGTPFMSEY